LVLSFGSLAVTIFGATWCQALDQLRVGVYALGLTLALIFPVILLLRARIAANAVAAERSQLMVPFKAMIGWTLVSIIALFFYSVGAVLIVNRALDFSQPTCHETRWVNKYYPTPPSGPSVVVQSWRSGRREEHFSISCFLYPELEQHSVIEVCTKKGWFELEWVTSVRVVHQAISDQTKAFETNPKDAEAYYNRGIAYANTGQHDQAISDYTKALELNPGYAEAYNNRGKAYSSKGQHDQAISDSTKALEMNPRHDKAYNNRGIAYFHKREYEKSWKDVEKAQSLGYQIDPEFLDNLRKASGRQN
jgi:hypothetical protein